MTKLILGLTIFLFALFFIPYVCMIAWNSWAWEFNLPQFDYWHWFVTAIAIHGLFGGARRIAASEE